MWIPLGMDFGRAACRGQWYGMAGQDGRKCDENVVGWGEWQRAKAGPLPFGFAQGEG
jgi:hypothetical protein